MIKLFIYNALILSTSLSSNDSKKFIHPHEKPGKTMVFFKFEKKIKNFTLRRFNKSFFKYNPRYIKKPNKDYLGTIINNKKATASKDNFNTMQCLSHVINDKNKDQFDIYHKGKIKNIYIPTKNGYKKLKLKKIIKETNENKIMVFAKPFEGESKISEENIDEVLNIINKKTNFFYKDRDHIDESHVGILLNEHEADININHGKINQLHEKKEITDDDLNNLIKNSINEISKNISYKNKGINFSFPINTLLNGRLRVELNSKLINKKNIRIPKKEKGRIVFYTIKKFLRLIKK